MSNANKQSGSMVLYVLLGIVVLVVIGFAGWYVMNMQPKAGNKTTKTDQSTDSSYLDIKEWGIKVPLDANFSYVVSGTTMFDGKLIFIRDKRVDAEGKAIQCDTDKGHVGSLFRSKTVEPGPAVYSSKVGDYYY